MKRESYEIWRHEESQTWKVFTNLTQDLRQTLTSSGWNPVVHYKEEEEGDGPEMCPEEILRRLSRGGVKPKNL